MAKLRPSPLKRGDKIGILAPSGAVQSIQIEQGVKALEREGYCVELAEGISERNGYLAGAAEQRVKALEQFFVRADIHAILCARGGFGSIQLLPLLDIETVRSHPKIFVGYSDVSVLLNWMSQTCGLVTFHGPMVVMDIAKGLTGRSKNYFWDTLSGKNNEWHVEGLDTLCPGTKEVRGEVVGGCLSVIVTTLGTPYEIQTKGKILFLEDIGEKPYRIERMLTHLKMAGKLDHVTGIVFGQFTDCGSDEERGLKQIVQEVFQDAGYPVLWDFQGGHGQVNLLLPFGVKMALNPMVGSLSSLESPTATR
jgi:muramoyltetrapeptide carboxypeptidase